MMMMLMMMITIIIINIIIIAFCLHDDHVLSPRCAYIYIFIV